jgi:hypothetical protein
MMRDQLLWFAAFGSTVLLVIRIFLPPVLLWSVPTFYIASS